MKGGPGRPKYTEEVRQQAFELIRHGLSRQEVGRRLGCHASTITYWENAAKPKQPKQLRPAPPQVAPPTPAPTPDLVSEVEFLRRVVLNLTNIIAGQA